MSILCWNCRGLGNWQIVQELGDLVLAQDPTVVFLAETWLDDIRLVGLRDSLRLVIIMVFLVKLVVVAWCCFGRRISMFKLCLLLLIILMS